MAGLFQNEPDEASPASLFQSEHDEQAVLFMDEPEETIRTNTRQQLPPTNFPYLHDEPHEPGDESDEGNDCAQLFQDENDEDESSCESDDDSGYSADCDDAPPPSKPTVDLAFATVSKFLASQLAQSRGQASTPSAQPLRKKRIYNNSNRAAKAQQRKAVLPPAAPKEKRNSPASWCGLTTCCICCFCCSAFQHLNLELKHVQSKERLSRLLASKCKCSTGECYMQYSRDQLQKFLDAFEERDKREQDAILYMAVQDALSATHTRRDYLLLDKPVSRACFETLIGIGSHRLDKAGAIDRRYKDTKDPSKPSPLAASVDCFCMIVYNSIAEPLPHKPLFT